MTKPNTTTYQAKVYVTGTLDSTTNAGTLTRTTTSVVRFGRNTNNNWAGDIWFDDIYHSVSGCDDELAPPVAMYRKSGVVVHAQKSQTDTGQLFDKVATLTAPASGQFTVNFVRRVDVGSEAVLSIGNLHIIWTPLYP